MPSDVRFGEVKKLLEAKGYYLSRTRGSHHIFKKPGTGSFSLPVHHGKVKPIYVEKINNL